MAFSQSVRSPRLSFLQTVVSLVLGALSLTSSYWVVGQSKVPKPLCTPTKHSGCIPDAAAVSNSTAAVQFQWETGDEAFVFPAFHVGLFRSCQEDIYSDAWEENCLFFHTLTPANEKAIMWLSVSMEVMYVGLLVVSCVLLSVQLCLTSSCCPGATRLRWGQLLNSFAAIFTVTGGLLGMVAHMMFMQVFQTTASQGPESFKPHSYSYSWAFYVAWIAFTFCMAAGVSTLNNYTKKILMAGNGRRNSRPPLLHPCGFNYVGPPPPPPPAPYYPSPDYYYQHRSSPPPHISPLSPYYEPPLQPPSRRPSLKHCHSLPLSFQPPSSPPSHPAPLPHWPLASPCLTSSVSVVHLPAPKDGRGGGGSRYDDPHEDDVYGPR